MIPSLIHQAHSASTEWVFQPSWVKMTEDKRKLCSNCAWRANCAKRFSMDDSTTLHCPDYSEDVTLRKVEKTQNAPDIEED